MKKILSLLLAVVLLFSACVLSPEPEIPEEPLLIADPSDPSAEKEPFYLRVPYDFEEGVLPYTTSGRSNRFICGLIYRSMIKLTSSYRYETDLLSAIKTEDNLTWYLYLDEGTIFPDGTEFTAYDLKYSIQEAMKEGSYYAESLNDIDSVTVVNATCCRVILRTASRYFPNLLTFPVISYETIRDPLFFPGRYSFSEDGKYLFCNEKSDAPIIELISSDDPELLVYEMRMGRYDCIYCRDPLSLGTSSVGAMNGLQSNRMVYLGFNSSAGFTYYSAFRKAVSAAIDYEYLCNYVYNHFAAEPKGIFNPDFYEVTYIGKRSLDVMSANLLLDDAGWTNRDGENYRTNSRGNRITLELLVCSESAAKVSAAKAIADMLKEIGIAVEVTSLPYASFMQALENHRYDLYLAEVRLDADMDLSGLLTPRAYELSDEEYINYGMDSYEGLYLKWLDYMSGTISATEFGGVFAETMPYVPLCYTKSSVIFSRNLPISFGGTDSDMFYDILNWQY